MANKYDSELIIYPTFWYTKILSSIRKEFELSHTKLFCFFLSLLVFSNTTHFLSMVYC